MLAWKDTLLNSVNVDLIIHQWVYSPHSERLRENAKRKIIDIDEMAAISFQLIDNESVRNVTLSINNQLSYSMIHIAAAMSEIEQITLLSQVDNAGDLP